ncbi:TonB-dependent receptor domain-containing protein [Chitinophaga caseinilytica]|uniref:TonB-dependent receptor domain-containing protein n=1 Tax=Chitinophaga caseinilytica TaxID=2267521 RepID=UPI003C2C32BF
MPNLVQRTLLTCLFLLSLTSLSAQIRIAGRATDKTTGAGIPFAAVKILSPDSVLVTGQMADSAGSFSFTGLRPAAYLLELSALGYETLHAPVPPGNAWSAGNLALTPAASMLAEVTIGGGRPAIQRQADRITVQITGNPMFRAAANAFDVLRKVPGLEVDGEGGILISGRNVPVLFIDGRPAQMSAEEIRQYLRSLRPDQIASIDVITQPSARYDAEFKAIIDLKLRRDQSLGWTGQLSSSLQQNQYTQSDNSLVMHYRTRQLTWSTRMGYVGGYTIYRYGALQHLSDKNTQRTRTNVPTRHDNYTFHLGAEYRLNDNHRLEAVFRGFRSNRRTFTDNTIHTVTPAEIPEPVAFTRFRNNGHPVQNNLTADLRYSGNFRKWQLELAAAAFNIGNRQTEDILYSDDYDARLPGHWKTALENDIRIRTVQADATIPAGNGKWNTGIRAAFNSTRNDLRYDTLGAAQTFLPDSSRSNNFKYDERIVAAYVSRNGTWNKTQYSIGLRLERTHTIARSEQGWQTTERRYLSWLPSFSLMHPLSDDQQLQLSFTRRMTRPNFSQLNPFRFYYSPLNYWVGNPQLKPSITNTLTIGYTIRTLSLTLQAGREEDPMARYPEYNRETHVLEYLGRNLPYNDFAGTEVAFPARVRPWWRMQNNFGLYYTREINPYHGVTYKIPILQWTVSGSQVFTLPAGITADISYNYRSKGGNGLYRSKHIYKIDAGLQKSWLKGKLQSGLNVYDMFDTYRVVFTFREKQIIDNQLYHWFGTRRAVASLSWRFGQSTYKADQRKRQEEENRVSM